MSTQTLELLSNWTIFIAVTVSLGLLLKMLLSFSEGRSRSALLSFGGLILWILFTLFLVFLVILSGMNHTSVGNSGGFVVVAVILHTLAGAAVLYFLFRPGFSVAVGSEQKNATDDL